MVISNTEAAANAAQQQQSFGSVDSQNHLSHPSGIPQDQIDNIMSGIANTGDVKMNNHRKKLKQRFDIIKKLGQGTYGKVQLGINKETGQEVAIKTIKKCKIEAEADLVRIRREVQIMSSVQHPNIIHIYEVFENREKMVLVMEFAAGGELYDYLSERKVLTEEEARRIFRQVATAVYYCHKHKICHRDLKLENILLDEHGNAKIADFGLSNVFDEHRLLATFCGSPLYASPEIVEGTPYLGPEVDCWSLGVLLYTLVYGSMPFDGSNFKRLVKQISTGDYYEPKQPSRASTLIRAMLTACPRKRATIEQICSHWWVNENDNISCLDLAEDLANQTPVRLDVLLSVTPTAITADQLVVPSADGKPNERIARSHSVGSIRDITAGTTEAEQRIIDMVAAGGEAALMPSPTRTITPAQSPVQSKRKLETTISTENAVGALKKKEKPSSSLKIDQMAAQTVSEEKETAMETDEPVIETAAAVAEAQNDNKTERKEQSTTPVTPPVTAAIEQNQASTVARQKTATKLDAVAEAAEKEEKEATKVIKKFVNKHKTADLVNAIGQATAAADKSQESNKQANAAASAAMPPPPAPPFVRKCSLQDESTLTKFNNTNERRKSRILETAEKFQQMQPAAASNSTATNSNEKPKKIVIPGVSVGTFKKEFERKATEPSNKTEGGLTPGEKRALEEVAAAQAAAAEAEAKAELEAHAQTTALTKTTSGEVALATPPSPSTAYTNENDVEQSDSRTSVNSLSLEDARRSMENSIALLRQAQNESSKEVDLLCAKTADIGVSNDAAERERKLKAARSIIGNAIQPVIRKPPIPLLFGFGGGGYSPERDDSGIYLSSTKINNNINNNSSNNINKLNNNKINGNAFGNKFNTATQNYINNNYNNLYNKHKTTPMTRPASFSQPAATPTPQPIQANTQPPPPLSTPQHIPRTTASVSNMALAAARQTIVDRLAAGGIGMSTNAAAGTSKIMPAFKPFHARLSQQQQATSPSAGGGINRFNSFSTSFLSRPPTTQPSNAQQQLNNQQQLQQNLCYNNKNTINCPYYANNDNNNNLFISTLPHQNQQYNQQMQQQNSMSQFRNAAATAAATVTTNSLNSNTNPKITHLIQNNNNNMNTFTNSIFNSNTATAITTINPKSIYTNATAATLPITNNTKATAAANNASQLINQINSYNSASSNTNATATTNSTPKPFYNAQPYPHIQNEYQNQNPQMASLASTPDADTVKTSTASITLKSATLPRRKPGAAGTGNKTEVQLEIKPRIMEQPSMRFTTEMQHPIADLRSAPPREGPVPYSPIKQFNARATSLEPKEHIIPIQRPPAYGRTISNTTTRSGSLSRQSTVDSETESTATTTNLSQSTIGGAASSQPIKKSPREFIIPIAVEGGGFITPREGSIEPSDSSHTAGTAASSRSTFSRLRPTRRIGSLLSDAGIDDNSPFQKLRTTSQISRDGAGDEDGRFALHRLRSSRPVKKISQENDDESSNEEDDDDGFEILTAESLFSTLLQRVRALTNRFNVNNDFTSGFPNSSRLLGNMGHRQSPFWNQEPFASHHNNSNTNMSTGGVPWRHSMSRDLGRDMESMFSRTGATLPRGSKTAGSTTKPPQAANLATSSTNDSTPGSLADDMPLDLADLDLSRLRLSKQELETLSSIAPGLPKCFQEQLLAKLPPTQARKLSRTLSMQNSPHVTTVKIYKRSQSGGRGCMTAASDEILKEEELSKPSTAKTTTTQITTTKTTEKHTKVQQQPIKQVIDAEPANNIRVQRRSLSRPRTDYDTTTSGIPTTSAMTASDSKSRSSSICRDDYSKSLCSTYTNDINDKYRYYSPYLSKSTKESPTTTAESGLASTYKRYSSVSPRESMASGVAMGRPPSGCLSPPPTNASQVLVGADAGSSSLRRRSTQRRVSRFLRPDFFDEPVVEENAYQRERQARERETQSVLREIREKSCEREELKRRKHSLPSPPATTTPATDESENRMPHHVRNKSMDSYSHNTCESFYAKEDEMRRKQRSVSRARDFDEDIDTHELADKILKELQILSAVRSQSQQRELQLPPKVHIDATIEHTTMEEKPLADLSCSTLKKVKKVKPKEKSTESSTDNDANSKLVTGNEGSVLVKKVKKIVKKTDKVAMTYSDALPVNDTTPENDLQRRESKLKRPKSYPTKELVTPTTTKSELTKTQASAIQESPNEMQNGDVVSNIAASTLQRESRLLRPKSYPASKLAAPKDLKKISRSGLGIEPDTPPEAQLPPAGERAATLKKTVKLTKKSKLATPTPVTPTTPTASSSTGNSSTAGDNSKETSPVKEKSPDKKPSKGLLYAIGQKFEKLRDSAMNKEKKTVSALSACTGASAKQSSSDSSPEKIKELRTPTATSSLKKKKSLENSTQKTEKTTKATKHENNASSEKLAGTIAATDLSVTETKPKTDKRSRFDSMLRSLRERSLSRATPPRQSAERMIDASYIKRALSVEDIPARGSRSHSAVNKVLGIFKRSDKEGAERRMRNARSTSNLQREYHENTPTAASSPIYQNADVVKREAQKSAARLERTLSCTGANCNCEIIPANCPECRQAEVAALKAASKSSRYLQEPAKSQDLIKDTFTQQTSREKRKGLMLDLSESTNKTSTVRQNKMASFINGNGTGSSNLYSNLPPYPTATRSGSNNSSSQHSVETTSTHANNSSNNNNNNSLSLNNNTNNSNNNNNNTSISLTSGYRTTSSAHEINRNALRTPSFENVPNYSSDSRSYQDDCASTSTFLSPTDEPELYFDNWSICSEDNYMMHATPSPTVSRLSRASQLSSPTRCESSDPNESVIDRIKRRSFYCRFNEKKPKRTSSIVGPSATRDYYREQQAAVKARSSQKLSERATSPDITQEFFRPLKLSPVGTELKPPIYRARPVNDYANTSSSAASSKARKSLNDIRPTSSSTYLAKRYGGGASGAAGDTDYHHLSPIPSASRYKSSSSSSGGGAYESAGAVGGVSGYYNTYNPKRRSSYTLNGSLPSGSGTSGLGSSSATNAGKSNIDSYATLGRRSIRAYDQRTMSLLDPSTLSSSYRRDARTPVRDYTSSTSRTNFRYHTPSTSRSPTNI